MPEDSPAGVAGWKHIMTDQTDLAAATENRKPAAHLHAKSRDDNLPAPAAVAVFT